MSDALRPPLPSAISPAPAAAADTLPASLFIRYFRYADISPMIFSRQLIIFFRQPLSHYFDAFSIFSFIFAFS
jgi:hypothetical protein